MRNQVLSGSALRASMLILSAAAMLSLAGCKDDVVDFEQGCVTNADCADGQICGDDLICVDDPANVGVCGDGVVDANEQCDDGEANSDTAADACRTDCTLPVCGDGVVDAGESCDEGTEGNDGVLCNADCTLPGEVTPVTEVFRCNSLAVVEPSFHLETATACEQVDSIVNSKVQDYVATPDALTGQYELNLVQSIVFPLPEAGVEFTSSMSFPSVCTAGVDGASDACELEGATAVEWTMVQPETDGPCFERIGDTANEDGWLDNVENAIAAEAIPAQGANTCLTGTVGDSFMLAFLGEEAELNGAYLAVELDESGETPSVVRGMIGGFITVTEAENLAYSGNSVGTINLAQLLNGGTDACVADVALDKGPDAAGDLTDGWWIYLSFGAEGVEVVTPE